MALLKFAGIGNETIIVRKSYKKIVTAADGTVITAERIPATKIVLENGYGELEIDDAEVAPITERIKKIPGWNRTFYWHPSMAKSVDDFKRETVVAIQESAKSRAKRIKKQIETAREGNVSD